MNEIDNKDELPGFVDGPKRMKNPEDEEPTRKSWLLIVIDFRRLRDGWRLVVGRFREKSRFPSILHRIWKRLREFARWIIWLL